jgi:Na+/melibiose symporter-like transporter
MASIPLTSILEVCPSILFGEILMTERLNKPLLYTFGIGDLFFTLMVNMELYFFPAFLTDFAQFSLIIFSLIIWITGFADIICALVAGVILQKVTLKFGGKYRSWLLVGPPIVAPLFILQFSKIGNNSMAALIIVLGFIASHLIFNVVFAATGSMVGTLSQLPDERTILSSSRAQGMSAAGLIFSGTALPMIAFFSARTDNILGHTIATAVYTALMILGYWYVYWISAAGNPDSEKSDSVASSESKQAVREIIGLVFKNPPLLLLIIAETFRNTSIFIITSFAFYYFGYVLKNPTFLSIFILSISVAALLGTFAAAWIGVKLGKRNSYWISLALSTFVLASGKLVGASTWGFTAIFCIGYMLAMVAGAMSTALFADSAVYGEWKTGKNIQGFTMALLTLPIKVGVLLRAAVMSVGLMAIGFVANTTPTQRVIEGINSIMIFSPALACALAALAFYFGYRIDDKHVLQMQDEIRLRPTRSPIS